MNTQRVAVTGLGIVSPLGNNRKTTWENLIKGQSGIAQIQQFDASHFPTRIAAEVKSFELSERLRKFKRQTISCTQYALQAAMEAMEDAGIEKIDQDPHRWGLVVGSGMMTAEFEYLKRFQQTAARHGEPDWHLLQQHDRDFLNLTDFTKTTSNAGLSLLAQAFNIKGYATSVHTACASGGQALGLALRAIRRGEVDSVLAGGFDSMITPLGLSSFCLLGALSTANDSPSSASRPFDRTRMGFVLGEGAAFLILENWDKAVARGAHIYAEFSGEGNSLSAYRITDSHPNGDGAKQAIQRALQDANLQAEDIDYVNAHGTSTKMNDLSETNAIKAVFGDRAYKIPVSSTKSQTGHLIAAAGALEAVFSVLSIHHGILPQTANLTQPDPECDLDYIVEGPRSQKVRAVLSNSFGFGGSNSCLLFTHPESERRTAMNTAVHDDSSTASTKQEVSSVEFPKRSNETRPVYITGMGLITASGHTVDENWQAQIQGQSSIAPIQTWDLTPWECQMGGEIKNFNAAAQLPDRKLMKAISRQDAIGIAVASQAIQQSQLLSFRDQLADPTFFNERTGVYVGSPGNKYLQQYDFLPLLSKSGDNLLTFADELFNEVHPMWLLRILPNNVLAYVGILHQLKGPNHNVTNHAVSGAQALLEAYHAIQSGEIDRAVVVAYDLGIDPQALFYYEKLGLLSSTSLNPFDQSHNGTILADGAAALILESKASADLRQATCLAEFLGGKTQTENSGLFSLKHDGEDLTHLIKHTLSEYGLDRNELAFIVAHGNGNKPSDDSESLALSRCFEQHQTPIAAFKWAMGHTLCASALVDTIIAVRALQSRQLPGIATLCHKADVAHGLNLSHQTRTLSTGNTALLINRGFANMNACLAIKACS